MKKKLIMLTAILTASLLLSISFVYGTDDYYGQVAPGPRGKIEASKTVATTLGPSTIKLTWKPVKGAKGYVIYKSMNEWEKDTYRRVTTLYGGSKSSYKDNTCKKNSQYYYEVFAFKYQNGQKVYSQTTQIAAASGVVKPYLRANVQSLSEVWVYTRSFGADKIVIYRSLNREGPFEKIGEFKSEEFSWADEDVTFKGEYYYKAKAYRKINGKTYASVWSDIDELKLYSPYLDIKVKDLNKPGERTDTFVYQLTSDQYNFPATIFKQGENELGKFDYSYLGEKQEGGSLWKSYVPVVLDSYSLNGMTYISFPDTYVLEPGKSIYLKFKAADKVTYYDDASVFLDMGYYSNRVNAGAIEVSSKGRNYYSYDY